MPGVAPRRSDVTFRPAASCYRGIYPILSFSDDRTRVLLKYIVTTPSLMVLQTHTMFYLTDRKTMYTVPFN